jgi:thiol-disulfide isomerase/thioredoxin
MKRRAVFFAWILALPIVASAQFYEPQTVDDDAVQRVFPVEAARVLAWSRGFEGAVAHRVVRSDASGTEWDITWLDAAGKPARTARVQCDAASRASGADFYRSAFRQLAGGDWAVTSTSPDNAAAAFWQGADLAGYSRVEGLLAAARLLADRPKVDRAADASRLAGVLVHSALPRFANPQPLDALLLARGAAWVCVAEMRLREPIDAAWAPVLFLAGRELEADDLWQSPKVRTRLRSGAEKWWAMALAEPRALDAFSFAARRQHRQWAMPAMWLMARKDARLFAPLREVAEKSLNVEFASRVHDFAPVLAGAAADWIPRDAARPAWLRCFGRLAGLPSEAPLDDLLAKAREWAPPTSNAGLKPVAAVTAEEIAKTMRGLALLDEAGQRPGVEHEPVAPVGPRLVELSDEDIATLAERAFEKAAENAAVSGDEAAPLPKFTDADAAWKFIQSLGERPPSANSPEDLRRIMRARLEKQVKACRQFEAAFPVDPRRWDARATRWAADAALSNLEEKEAAIPDDKELESVLDAPDASAHARGEAAYWRVSRKIASTQMNERHELPAVHRELAEFLEKHPAHEKAPLIALYQLTLIEAFEAPGNDAMLERLAAHSNPKIASQAGRIREQRARFSELKKMPLDLKFTAASGETVDFTKLRGKVVLLDFWASWCGPCIADAPEVVALAGRLNSRGFEVIGVSLDEDRAAFESAVERLRMAWPHHFDGKGWENEIARKFGIRSIPSTWLFDRKGKLRETGLRGEELGRRVEVLLEE